MSTQEKAEKLKEAMVLIAMAHISYEKDGIAMHQLIEVENNATALIIEALEGSQI